MDKPLSENNREVARQKLMMFSPTNTNVESNQLCSNINSNGSRQDSPTSDILDRLSVSLDRNSLVLEQTVEAMKSFQPNRSQGSENDSILIPNTKRTDKVLVEVKCTFLKINDIDTINQQFEAEIFVQAKWEESLLEQTQYGQEDQEKEDLDKLVPWDPKLIVMNIDGAFVLNRKTFDIRFHEPGYKHPVVIQLWRFKGFFKENLELEHFPVDVQDLTISISTERSDKEVELLEDQTALSSINTRAFMDQEWTLYKHIETFRDFTTMLIISLTFAAFTIDYTVADRITVTITLFLTAVAFKLVVKQSLPTISYLTYLDVYVIASLIFLGLQAAQNATMNAMAKFVERKQADYYDKWSMVLLAILLVLWHIIFGLFIFRTASKRRRVMEEKDKMYCAKKEFLEQYGTMPPRYDSPHGITRLDSFIHGRRLKVTATRPE